jgi:hypothetical protein
LKRHVVITGTGRCGTTFLIELLTNLNLNTGFSSTDLQRKNPEARAGLESDIRKTGCPYIVKSPWFCDYADEVMDRKDVLIEHIFIPIRDLFCAAESRRYVTRLNYSKLSLIGRLKQRIKPKSFHGGLWHTDSLASGEQEEILLRQLYNLMLALSNAQIPVTLMRYPRIVRDSEYLYQKLKPIMPTITLESFCDVFARTVRPEFIHSFDDNDR